MHDAEVHLVGTSISNDRTIKVHGHIHEEEKNKFITGMFVEADIICDSRKEISLPKSAILQNENHYFALVLKDKKDNNYQLEKVKLNVGLHDENYAQVKNYEVLENKKVLTKGVSMSSINFSE